MFGLHSSSCCRQGQKWLRAVFRVRGRKESHSMTCEQHPWNKFYSGIPALGHFPSTLQDNLLNVNKYSGKRLFSSEKLTDTDVQDLMTQVSEEDGDFNDTVNTSYIEYSMRSKQKRIVGQLDECYEICQESLKSNKPADLWAILPRSFPRIVASSLNQGMPASLRGKCLRLLLLEETDHKLTEKLLKQTLRDSHRLPINILVDIVQMLSLSKPTELRMETRRGLVVHLVNKRWYEIGQSSIVSVMYQLDELFDMKAVIHEMRTLLKSSESGDGDDSRAEAVNTFQNPKRIKDSVTIPVQSSNLERCILDRVDELRPKDLVRILTLMGRWRSRNQTLLAAVIHRLCLADLSDFRYVQLTNLLFACSTLMVHNDILVDKVSKLLSSMTPPSVSLAASALTFISRLKWYDPEFVSKCLAFFGDHMQELKGKEACSVLMSVANLYALPETEEHSNVITALANQALSSHLSNVDRVNVICSLAILQSMEKDHLGAVLEQSFVNQFNDTSKFQNRSSLQKLESISTAAKLELASYNGPYLESDALSDSFKVQETKADKELRSTLTNALSKFVSISSYAKEGERLAGGYTADALMCADEDGSLKPLSDLEKEKDSEKQLHRLAIKVIPFKGVIGSHHRPTGIYQMESRHLRAMGYTPVLIVYSDLHQNKSALEHVNTIQERIKESVKSI